MFSVLVDHLVITLEAHGMFHHPGLFVLLRSIGHAGVLAFFVHTSLVLMYSLERLHSGFDRVAIRFYIRRIFRIYPLAILAILVVLAFDLPSRTWDPTDPRSLGLIVSNLLLVQNLTFTGNVLTPLWSLPYEVQMYVLLPALYLLANRRRGTVYILMLIGASVPAGVVLFHTTGHLNMAEYVPCFLSGVLCFSLREQVRPRVPAWLWPMFLTGLIALYAWANPHTKPIYWVGWIFTLVLGTSLYLFRESRQKVLNAAAKRVALYSYGAYLAHIPILYFLFVNRRPQHVGLSIIGFFVLTAFFSALCFHLVESPYIDLGRRLSQRGKRPGRVDLRMVAPAP